MRCKKIRIRLSVQDPDHPMPSDMADHLSQCESCRLFLERDVQVRRFVSLKNHERPPAASAQRVARAVREIMAERWNPRPVESGQGFRGAIFSEPLPALRYAAVAVLFLLAAVHMLRMPPLDAPPPPAAGVRWTGGGVTEVADPLQPVAESPVSPAFVTASNGTRGMLEYGPRPSIPVRFDY